jgi:hypothetical protein
MSLIRWVYPYDISLIYFNFCDFFFPSQVWSNYFNLAVSFLTQPSLQLEKFSDVKREKIIEKYGDMRVQMGFQILKVWSSLGNDNDKTISKDLASMAAFS